jgi:cobaltochelatase CobS
VIALIEKHAGPRAVDLTVRDAQGEPKGKTIKGAHKVLPRVLRTITTHRRQPVLLCGPAGAGKSTIAEQAADALGVAFYSTGAVFQKYELTGFVDAGGTYRDTQLFKAVTLGGVFLWDEIDASHPGALVSFNQGLANGIWNWPDGTQTTTHTDCYFIAAANTAGTGATRVYTGRNALDGATLDRFYVIDVEYDLDLELRLTLQAYSDEGGEDQNKAIQWLTSVRAVRAHAVAQKWQVVISPRASISGAALLAAGESEQDINAGILFKHLNEDQATQAKRVLSGAQA